MAAGAATAAATTLAAPAYAAAVRTFRNGSNTALCLDAAGPNEDVGPGASVTAWPCYLPRGKGNAGIRLDEAG